MIKINYAFTFVTFTVKSLLLLDNSELDPDSDEDEDEDSDVILLAKQISEVLKISFFLLALCGKVRSNLPRRSKMIDRIYKSRYKK